MANHFHLMPAVAVAYKLKNEKSIRTDIPTFFDICFFTDAAGIDTGLEFRQTARGIRSSESADAIISLLDDKVIEIEDGSIINPIKESSYLQMTFNDYNAIVKTYHLFYDLSFKDSDYERILMEGIWAKQYLDCSIEETHDYIYEVENHMDEDYLEYLIESAIAHIAKLHIKSKEYVY